MSGTQRPLVRREGLIPGPPGNAGPPGGIGPAGVPGPPGAQGAQGPAGPQGTGITPKGSVASPSALPTTGNSPGDLYIVTSSGDGYNSGDGYSYTGSGNDAGPGGNWHNIGPIRGPQGPQGQQGNPGATGAQGPQGTQGVQGNTGPQGPQGNPTTVNGKTGASITLAAADVGAPTAASPQMTGVGALLEGQSASPTSSHGGLTFQNTTTTAAGVLGPQQPPSYFTHDGIRSTVVNQSDSSAQTTSAFGFYTYSLSASKDATGIFGTSVAAVDGAAVWGFNPTVIDAPANGAVTTGKNRRLIGIEINPTVTSTGTTVQGVSILGSSQAQPSYAAAFTVGHLNAGNPGQFRWNLAYAVSDGSSLTGYLTGAQQVSGSSISGIQNLLNYRDANGLAQAVTYASSQVGGFNIGGTAAANGITIVPAAAGQFPSIQSFGSDANPGLVLQAQGLGQVVAQSLLNANAGFYCGSTAQFALPPKTPAYTVATLPTAGQAGRIAYATNVRVLAPSGSYFALQAAGAGTGGLVVDDGNAWRVVGTNQGAAA